MRALVIDRIGGPIAVRELPMPPINTGEVLIKVAASAVNPVDLQVRSGEVPGPLPSVVGWDVSGVVERVGAEVDEFAVGDQVVAMSAQAATGLGTATEYLAAPVGLVGSAPRSVALVDAAALPLGGLTAAQALDTLGASDGRKMLVVGGAGAVGGYAVSLAKQRGWRVAAVGRASDAELIGELGADEVLADATMVVPESADVVLDAAGVPGSIAAVRTGGRFVTVTPRRLPKPERDLTPEVIGVEQDGAMLAELAALVDAGVLRLRIARVFAFAEAESAYDLLGRGGARGKVLLVPGS